MTVKLETLIEKIKKEGVEEANQAAEEILQNARKEADTIKEKARQDADEIREEARSEGDRFRRNAELAIQHAVRDAQLLLRERFVALFDRVFRREVGEALSPDLIKALIEKVIDKWIEKEGAEIIVAKADKKNLEKVLFAGLKKELKDSVILKTGHGISGGFRIGKKGEDVYYDFTDESIAALLKSFLNPSLNEILNHPSNTEKDG